MKYYMVYGGQNVVHGNIATLCFVIISVEIRGGSSCNTKRFITIREITTQ